jgi:hypothetical protein
VDIDFKGICWTHSWRHRYPTWTLDIIIDLSHKLIEDFNDPHLGVICYRSKKLYLADLKFEIDLYQNSKGW